MKKIIIIWSEMNEMGFGVEVEEEDVERATKIAEEGFRQWNDSETYPEYHDVGYAEPSMWLLDEAGIKYRILNEEEITDPNDRDCWRADLDIAYTSNWGFRKREINIHEVKGDEQ